MFVARVIHDMKLRQLRKKLLIFLSRWKKLNNEFVSSVNHKNLGTGLDSITYPQALMPMRRMVLNIINNFLKSCARGENSMNAFIQ